MEAAALAQEKEPLPFYFDYDADSLAVGAEDGGYESAEDAEQAEKERGAAGQNDAMRLYLREIQKAKLLTFEEEKELATKIAHGDQAARERMIVSNLRLVVKLAKGYRNRGLPFLDLIGEGNLGLIKAVEGFQPSKGCRFSTYATWWIRHFLEMALVNQSRTIHLPVRVWDEMNRVLRVTRELLQKKYREPNINEVAEALGVDVARVQSLIVLSRTIYSIDLPMTGTDFSLAETLEAPSTASPAVFLEDLSQYKKVAKCLDRLTEMEKKIITLRFGLEDQDPQTLDTLGRSFGVTRERIRQIEVKALDKVRVLVNMHEIGHDNGGFPPSSACAPLHLAL